MQRGGPQEFGKGLRLPGEGIRDVTEVSHQLLNEVWKCLQTGYLDDLKTSESRLKTSAIVWKRLIQTFQIFGKILMLVAIRVLKVLEPVSRRFWDRPTRRPYEPTL